MSQEVNDMSAEEIAKKQQENCIFCKIIKGDIPSHKVYEDEDFLAILDINPSTKGHVLILPKTHVPITPLLQPEITAKLGRFVKIISSKLLKALNCKGTSVFVANGYVAGQNAPHLIVHVISRTASDEVNLNPKREEREGYDEVHKKIVETIGGNVESDVLMEDDDIIIVHPKKNVINGELRIFVTNKYVILEQVPDKLIEKIFQVTNKLSALLFDKLGFQGTNILIQNGEEAGQQEAQFSISIIPRKENDGLNLKWEPKQANPNDLKEVIGLIESAENKIKEEEYIKSKQEKLAKTEPKEDVVEAKKEEKEEDNYLARSLDRTP
ncbi:MAG: HIT domain-containing protein [Candidatus Woesearchaeota archaeon]